MKQSTVHDIDDHGHAVHHRKPRHMAEKIEAWGGRAFMLLGVALLGGLLYAFMQTGSSAPTWMH
jgi:hypothetical protein